MRILAPKCCRTTASHADQLGTFPRAGDVPHAFSLLNIGAMLFDATRSGLARGVQFPPFASEEAGAAEPRSGPRRVNTPGFAEREAWASRAASRQGEENARCCCNVRPRCVTPVGLPHSVACHSKRVLTRGARALARRQ